MRQLLAIFTMLMLCLSSLTRAAEIKIYDLHHQLADNLLPVIQQTLQPGESVQSFNNQLVVNASAASQQQVGDLLQELDKPMRSLMISVRNLNDQHGTSHDTGVSGGIRTGDVYLGAGGPVYREHRRGGNGGGMVIQHDGLRVHTEHEVRQKNTEQEQQVRAIEGEPAWISTGNTIAYRSRDQWGNPVTDFRDANQGFYVTARLVGDRVQLQISTSNDHLSEDPRKQRRGIIETERLDTSASGAIGEWIPLGAITSQERGNVQGTTHQGRGSAQQLTDIAVRVVPLD